MEEHAEPYKLMHPLLCDYRLELFATPLDPLESSDRSSSSPSSFKFNVLLAPHGW